MHAVLLPLAFLPAHLHLPATCLFVTTQGLLGHLFFAEHITLRWVLGISLVICGLLLISLSVVSSTASSAAAPATAANAMPGVGPGQQQQQQQLSKAAPAASTSSSSQQGTAAAKKRL